jgi:flagellar motor switch protein FliN/FliY
MAISDSTSRSPECPFELDELDGEPKLAATLLITAHERRELRVELGRARLYADEVERLTQGAVVALDKLMGDPADIYASGRLVARGELLVVDGNFGVRILELVAPLAGQHTTRLAAAG